MPEVSLTEGGWECGDLRNSADHTCYLWTTMPNPFESIANPGLTHILSLHKLHLETCQPNSNTDQTEVVSR